MIKLSESGALQQLPRLDRGVIAFINNRNQTQKRQRTPTRCVFNYMGKLQTSLVKIE